MKVKDVYFFQQFPGLPVYKLTSGQLMLPFSKQGTFNFFWATEDQITKGVSDTKKLYTLRAPFRAAELEIKNLEEKLTVVN